MQEQEENQPAAEMKEEKQHRCNYYPNAPSLSFQDLKKQTSYSKSYFKIDHFSQYILLRSTSGVEGLLPASGTLACLPGDVGERGAGEARGEVDRDSADEFSSSSIL